MKVEEESETADLLLNVQKTKLMVSSPITLWKTGENMEVVIDFIFLGSKIAVDGECCHEIKKTHWKESYKKRR